MSFRPKILLIALALATTATLPLLPPAAGADSSDRHRWGPTSEVSPAIGECDDTPSTMSCAGPLPGCLTRSAFEAIKPGWPNRRVHRVAGGGPVWADNGTAASVDAYRICNTSGFVLVRTDMHRVGRTVTGTRILRTVNRPKAIPRTARPADHALDPGCFTRREYRTVRDGWRLARVEKHARVHPILLATEGGATVRLYEGCTVPGLVMLRTEENGRINRINGKRSLFR